MLRQRPLGRAGKVLLQQRSGGDQVPYACRDHQSEQKCRCRSIVFSGSTKTGCCKVRMPRISLYFFFCILLFAHLSEGEVEFVWTEMCKTLGRCKIANVLISTWGIDSPLLIEHCHYYVCGCTSVSYGMSPLMPPLPCMPSTTDINRN